MLAKSFPGYAQLKYAVGLSLLIASYLIIGSIEVGRDAFFLQWNTNLGKFADFFFEYWTYLGDGFIWVLIAFLFYIYKRSHFPFLIACIAISTFIAQFTKNYIVVAEPRPTAAITDFNAIHTVPGVELHTAYSFPSGHTTTAFTIFYMACLLINKKWIFTVGLIYALLVGYSRVYLAQHFPLDVAGGIIAATITIYLSILIQQKFKKQ